MKPLATPLRMKRVSTGILAGAFSLFIAAMTGAMTEGTAAAADALKIAVVDLQYAVANTEDGLRAQATLKKVFENRQQEIQKKEQDLAKQQEDLQKQARVMSREAFQRKEEQFRKEYFELQAMADAFQKELARKRAELINPLIERVQGNIKRLASQEGYDVIIDKPAAPFYRSDLDVTDKIIRLSNGGGGKAKDDKKDKAAPAASER